MTVRCVMSGTPSEWIFVQVALALAEGAELTRGLILFQVASAASGGACAPRPCTSYGGRAHRHPL